MTEHNENSCQYLYQTFPTFKVIFSPFRGAHNAGRNQQGYGRKIPMDYKIQIGSRCYRVYCCCFSNAGTCYINTKKHKFLIVLDGDLSAVR